MPDLRAMLLAMGTKSRESIYGASSARRLRRKHASRPTGRACEAWNKRMLAFQGPALGDALNAGCGDLEVKCLGCNTHQTIALRYRRSMNWNATWAAASAPKCGVTLQAQPSRRAEGDKEFCPRSAINVVAEGAMTLFRRLQLGRSQPFAYVRAGLRLASLPQEGLAARSRWEQLCFLA